MKVQISKNGYKPLGGSKLLFEELCQAIKEEMEEQQALISVFTKGNKFFEIFKEETSFTIIIIDDHQLKVQTKKCKKYIDLQQPYFEIKQYKCKLLVLNGKILLIEGKENQDEFYAAIGYAYVNNLLDHAKAFKNEVFYTYLIDNQYTTREYLLLAEMLPYCKTVLDKKFIIIENPSNYVKDEWLKQAY